MCVFWIEVLEAGWEKYVRRGESIGRRRRENSRRKTEQQSKSKSEVGMIEFKYAFKRRLFFRLSSCNLRRAQEAQVALEVRERTMDFL